MFSTLSIKQKNHSLRYIYFVVCKWFQFGPVQNCVPRDNFPNNQSKTFENMENGENTCINPKWWPKRDFWKHGKWRKHKFSSLPTLFFSQFTDRSHYFYHILWCCLQTFLNWTCKNFVILYTVNSASYMLWKRALTHSYPMTHFDAPGNKPFENTVEKGKIARNEQFVLFSQCFSTRLDNLLPFSWNLKFRLQTLSVWKSLKFVVW